MSVFPLPVMSRVWNASAGSLACLPVTFGFRCVGDLLETYLASFCWLAALEVVSRSLCSLFSEPGKPGLGLGAGSWVCISFLACRYAPHPRALLAYL